MSKRRTPNNERGAVLVLSLLVVTIGMLVGTSIIYYAGADRRAAQMGVRRVQARAMAWSGVQAVMAQLADQRDALLAGEAPEVVETWVALESVQGSAVAGGRDGGVRWGFRVLPVANAMLVSEMGKLDINTAPAEVLAKLPGVGEQIASRIVSARATRPFTSVAELLSVDGITVDLLYGAGGARESGELAGTPLSRLVTVYSFDPEVQVGFGPEASEAAGKQRININAPWSEELGEAIEDRFDRNVATGVKSLMERGEKFEKPSSIVKKLRELRVEPKDWLEILDAFTTNPDQYRLGAVDLLTAPLEVLACIPGIGPEAAQEIVDRRPKLDASRRSTVAWPVLEGILTPEEFEKSVDFLTSRSLQWRVVVEGGVVPQGPDGATMDPGPDWEPAPGSLEPGTPAAPLQDRVVLEAVIDVASLRPRVAYLRDVTFLPTARGLAADEKDRELAGRTVPDAFIPGETGFEGDSESSPDGFHTDLNTPVLEKRAETPEDGGLELSRLESASDASEDAKKGGEPRSTPPGGLPEPRDRRLGRWTTGRGGA